LNAPLRTDHGMINIILLISQDDANCIKIKTELHYTQINQQHINLLGYSSSVRRHYWNPLAVKIAGGCLVGHLLPDGTLK